MRFLYAADLHGVKWMYRALLDYAVPNSFHYIIIGGDLYPKEGKGTIYDFQRKFLEGFFADFLKELESKGIYLLFIPGNDDLKSLDELLEELLRERERIFNLDGKKVVLNGFEFIGFSLVKDHPFLLKDRTRRDLKGSDSPRTSYGFLSVGRKLQRRNWEKLYYKLPSLEEELTMLPKPEHWEKTVFVSHQPPWGLNLAVTYRGKDEGSLAVRNFLEEFQPLVSLHGHIHESVEMTGIWRAEFGRTICIQPGQNGDFFFVEANLENLKFTRKKIEFPYKNKGGEDG